MLQPDFVDLLGAFANHNVRYMLIGGYAVAFYGYPRFTQDFDLWIDKDPDNLQRVRRALEEFGAPPHVIDDLDRLKPHEILYVGAPPFRIDFYQQIPGPSFQEAYRNRLESTWDGIDVVVIGRQDLLRSKAASGRDIDRQDIQNLQTTL